MPYIINNRNNDTIIIPDGELNQDYSVDLVGRNYENYGQIIATGFVDLLNNFASASAPAKATDGQLWYDNTLKKLRVYDSTSGGWKPTGILVSSSRPTNTFGLEGNGTAYYDTSLGQLYIHANGGYQLANKAGEISDAYVADSALGNPAEYGTTLRNIYLTDTAGVKRAVMALVYVNSGENSAFFENEKVIAIFSGHSQFEAADQNSVSGGVSTNYYAQLTETGGIGVNIQPGINLRSDNNSEVERAQQALRADVAYALNEGSYGNDSANNIAASTVFHSGKDVIPGQSTHQLGNTANKWAETHTGDVVIGGVTAQNYLRKATGSWVSIGSASNEIDEAHIEDLYIAGNLTTAAGDVDLSTSNVSANNLTANSVTIDGYTLPIVAGTNSQQIYIDANGDCHWADPASTVSDIIVGNGIEIVTDVNTVNPVTGSPLAITQRTVNLDIDESYIRNLFSGATNIDYDTTTGVITNTYTSPFDTYEPADFVKVTTNQTVGGVKTFTSAPRFNDGIEISDEISYSGTQVFRSSATEYVSFASDGSIYTTGDITGLSDARVKTDLVKIENALDKVDQLTGYVYTRTDIDQKQTGLIAQDVKKVLPEAVKENADGLNTVAYGNMMGLIVQSIKELRQEIEQLKKGN